MEFRLTYEGILSVTGSAEDTHDIRKEFHKQLKTLWDWHPMLQSWNGLRPTSRDKAAQEGLPRRPAVEAIGDEYASHGFRWVPLVTSQTRTLVGLDILFLRYGEPGIMLKSGDIDARVGILFDALQIPAQPKEMGSYAAPGLDADENPFFVLTQNDKLIANVSVQTDMLLQPTTPERKYNKNDARVVIAVQLKSYWDSRLVLP